MPAKRPPPGRKTTLRDEQKQFTRQRLKEAALQVFGERGYRGATIDLIAGAAGASRTTLYLHFDSKASLLAAMIDDMMAADFPVYYRALDDALAAGTREALREWLQRWIDWVGEHRAIVDAIDEALATGWDLKNVSPALLEHMPRYRAQWSGREAEGQLRLLLLVMTMLLGAQGALEMGRVSGAKRPEGALLDLLVDVFRTALQAPRD